MVYHVFRTPGRGTAGGGPPRAPTARARRRSRVDAGAPRFRDVAGVSASSPSLHAPGWASQGAGSKCSARWRLMISQVRGKHSSRLLAGHAQRPPNRGRWPEGEAEHHPRDPDPEIRKSCYWGQCVFTYAFHFLNEAVSWSGSLS